MTNLKFLVIEDDLFYQNYVNDLLAESGIDIVNAADGETGLQLALSEKPDLIITDIEIPRIQGFVLLKNLRDRPGTRDIPVIMMSGKVEKDMLDRHAKLRVRADGYLLKPFSGQDLLNKINEVLGPESGFAYKEEPSQAFPVENGPGTEEQVQVFEGTDEKIPGQPAKDRTLNALIVDDSQYICDIARDFLQEMGFNVIIAKDGEEGLEVALDVVPDLVLLDVQMPKMNGFVVCEKLRKEDSTGNVPIILMSAVVDDESFQRHSKLRYRADAYLQKPFMKSELQDLARQFTSIRGPKPSDVESKTGFLVPSEEELRRAEGTDKKAGPARVDTKVAEELKKAQAALETLRSRESSLTGQLEAMKNERDRMEEEVYRITSQAENTEKQLSDKLTLATQRLDEMRASLQRAQEEEGEAAQGEAAAGADDVISGLREQLSEAAAENEALRGELEGVRSELQSLSMEKEEQAPDEELQARTKEALESAETLRSENASLKAEIDELKASKAGEGDAEDSAAALQEKIRFLEEGKAGLTRDLKAAVAAKNEIEDQVKTILKRREGEPDAEELKGELAQVRDQVKELTNRAAEAESRTKWLADVQSQLEKAQEENRELRQRLQDVDDSTEAEVTTMRDKLAAAQAMAESLQEGKDQISSLLEERSSLVEELQTELNRSRKLAASETEARMELEGKLKSLREEKKVLASRLEEAHRELDEAPVGKASESGLEERLEEEGRLRAKAESEAVKLRRDLEKVTLEKDRLEELGRTNSTLVSEIGVLEERCRELQERLDEAGGEEGDATAPVARLTERLDQLEETLSLTVQEAQGILREQQERETTLERNIQSLMKSLEEERSTFSREREQWRKREVDLREAFEDALSESRRLMGEEASRLFPMIPPKQARPLEVTTGLRKYGTAAALAAGLFLVFVSGYIVLSRRGPADVNPSAAEVNVRSVPQPREAETQLPRPYIAPSKPKFDYEELWRRQTVQSVSEDIMIQATLHTREELQAAIRYTAGKEGWSMERTQQAMDDLARTYDLEGSYYVTVFSKNLKGGYPGYAENFERHIALRDETGREARAVLPAEFEGSKFITSRVSSAGKEMNSDFLYEVGLTVSFPRRGLKQNPQGLQLVLYDVGAVPMRVLTWDLSTVGSPSHGSVAGKERSPS